MDDFLSIYMMFGCVNFFLEILFSFSLTLCKALSFSVGFWLLPQNLDFRSAHCPASTVHTSGLHKRCFFFNLFKKNAKTNFHKLIWPIGLLARLHTPHMDQICLKVCLHTSGLYKHVFFLNLNKKT